MANALENQVRSLPELIKTETWRLEDELRKIVPTPTQHSIRQILLTGCGDSAIAGQATEHTFRKFVRVPTLAGDAMSISRYALDLYDNEYPNTPFVIATSNSGGVARVVEAARKAAKVGGYVVGLTGNADSPLGQTSNCTVNVAAPEFESAPGMRSYVMALLSLNLFAIRFAEVRGNITMDEAQAMRGEIAELGAVVEALIESANDELAAFAQEIKDVQGVEFLGSGPSRATAAFSSAKILEATGKQSSHIDVEEFFHLNYFERAADSIATVLIAPRNSAAQSRANELAPILTNLKRPWIAFGDVEGAPRSISVPEVREEFTPIVYAALGGLLAAHLMDATGEEPGRGAVGQWADCVDGNTTKNSAIQF